MPEPKSISLPIYSESDRFEVDHLLAETHFGCDLSVCKGACCTMPGALGAPILQRETAELERVYPAVKQYLQDEAFEIIERKGLWQREMDGSLTIPAIRGRDCIFVTYEGDVAKCAIEKAYRNGEIEGFPKPISCHLFPIRIYPTGSIVDDAPATYHILYEEIPECEGGRKRGMEEEIPLLDFLESPLIRALGEERVERLRHLLQD
ncbi:MAG TPA: DUF3109 family protein [Candidatus Kapabacteria bacterium]|jgi:hypothetical protein|nr:DUF3109 family protein [Candidatus Kapabacteria bacterium]